MITNTNIIYFFLLGCVICISLVWILTAVFKPIKPSPLLTDEKSQQIYACSFLDFGSQEQCLKLIKD